MDNVKENEVLWEVKNLTKVFPGIKALDDVSIQFRAGEIHALLGENGSGKSTLIKCISGVHHPENGDIYHLGNKVKIHNPIVSRKLGVATIFQEFSLVPTLSVCENIFLGRLPKKNKDRSAVDWEQMKSKSAEILAELGLEIDPMATVGKLSVAQQQLVEITKAISIDASLFIMDEPTAALGLSEIEQLHTLTRKMRDRGCAIIYISHRLDEVVNLVDCVTVLKDGKVVGICNGEINTNEIVRLMVGSDIKEHYPKEYHATNEVIYRAKKLTTQNGVNEATFDLRRGEVLGLAGLIGSGRTEIARAIFGVDALKSGSVEMFGNDIQVKRPIDAIKNKIAFLTENRKSDGLFMNFFTGPNITIVDLRTIMKKNHFLGLKKERMIGQEYIGKMQITATALNKYVKFLSGGNQQKVIIARWLHSEAEIFILDEPTQGIDINAKVEVYNLINQLTAAGKSVILISSDFDELIAMSDRLAIVKGGHIMSVADAKDITKNTLMQIILGNQSILEVT